MDTNENGDFPVVIDVDTGVGISLIALVALPAFWVGGDREIAQLVFVLVALLASSAVAATAATFLVRRPGAWRTVGAWRTRRRFAAVVGTVAGVACYLLMPASPSWPWAVAVGIAALPALLSLWVMVVRWKKGRAIAKGEASADDFNQILPEARVARWADVGESFGWRLGRDRRSWTRLYDSPRARLSLAGALDLREWRARWQRGAWELRQGTPELPGTDRTITPDRMGIWSPGLLRQVVYAASGHGKSVQLTRLLAHAINADADVLIIDGKGARADADAWELTALRAGVPSAHVKRWPEQPLRLLDGLPVNVQAAMLAGLIETVRGGVGHAFYEGEAKTAISAALRVIEADVSRGPITLGNLLELLESPPVKGGSDIDILNAEVSRGLTRAALAAQSLRPVVDAVGDTEGAQGWPALPEPGWWRVGIVSANVQSTAGAAVTAALLQRLAAGVAERSGGDGRSLFVIVDEAAAVLRSSEMAQGAGELLAAQGRSAGMPATWAFQDRSQIPPEWADAVETSAEVIWVGRTGRPQRYLEIGGNTWQEEATRPGVSDAIADTSVRAQTSYGLRPEVLEQLPVWGWACYADGQWCAAFAPPIPNGPADTPIFNGKGAAIAAPAAAFWNWLQPAREKAIAR